MTQNISVEQASEALQQLADGLLVDDMRGWSAAALRERFVQARNQHRTDPVIQTVGGIIEHAAKVTPERMFSAHDLLDLYTSTAGLSGQSAFKTVFADLLPSEITQTSPDNDQSRVAQRRHQMFDDGRDLEVVAQSGANTIEVDELSDETPQRNQLGEIIDPMDFVHDPNLIQEAQSLAVGGIQHLGQHNIQSRFIFGDQGVLVYNLDFQGPNGEGHISIPIEIEDGQIMMPTHFGTSDKGYPLTEAGLQDYFSDQAVATEQMERQAATKIRDVLGGEVRDLDETGSIEVDEDQLIGEDERSAILPEGLEDVEALLTQAVLRKESRYAGDTIDTVAQALQRRLYELGFKNAQVVFTGDATANAMRFLTRLTTAKGTADIGIPVEVHNGVPMTPVVFIGTDESIYELSPQGLSNYFAKEDAVEPIKYGAEITDLTFNELQAVVHKAAMDSNSATATEALNLIGEKFGRDAYNNAITDYQHALSGVRANHHERCEGCSFYRPAVDAAAMHADDHCLLLHTACKRVDISATGRGIGHCTRSSTNFRAEHEKARGVTMSTSQVALT